jgi:hypothetical protein
MARIEALRVDAVELAHPGCKIPIGRGDEQMVVIAHLAGSMHRPVVAIAYFGEQGVERPPIRFFDIEGLTPVAPRGDVVKPARDL